MTRQVIERNRLGVLTKIAQGGQGVVYRAPNVRTKFAASMVYKEYKPATLADIDFAALTAMPALVEDSLSYADAERLISIAAWPCALVEDGGATTGFVMPAIPEEFFIPLTTVKGVTRSPAEFQHLLNHSSVLAARGITLDDAQRYTLLRETASALAFFHKHGVCVGDISPKNLLFSLTPHPGAYFLDCDAMRINTVSVLPQVETPGWQAPGGEELATIYTDTYKLGLLALRLLAGDHDTTNPQHLPANTPDMLRQIITDTLTNSAHRRPLPEAWNYVLGNAIEQAQHRQKSSAATPLNVELVAPEVPVVHSRPSTPTSAPPTPQPRPPIRPPSPPRDATPQRRRSHKVGRRRAIAILAAPAVALIAAVVFAGTTVRLYLDDRAEADAKHAIVKTATDAITTLWTYTPDDVSTLPDRASQYLGGDFQAQFSKFVNAMIPATMQARVTNTAQVLGAGVESLSHSDATAVVYANAASSTPQTRDKPSIKYLSYRLMMQKHDSRWVIVRMTTITSMDYEPKVPAAR